LYLKGGYVKVALALGRGKKSFDKREVAQNDVTPTRRYSVRSDMTARLSERVCSAHSSWA
jgi:tmRNA-binding protein